MDLTRAPITVAWLLGTLFIMYLQVIKLASPLDLYFDFNLMMKNQEYYRLITSLLYFGPAVPATLFSLLSFANFASLIEVDLFGRKPAEFVVFLLYVSISSILSSVFTREVFFGPIITLTCLYYWTKHHGNMSMQIMGLPINIKAAYAPFAYAAMNYYRQGFWGMIPNVIGIVLGHLYFYFHDVTNVRFGKKFIGAPKWLNQAFEYVEKLFV